MGIKNVIFQLILKIFGKIMLAMIKKRPELESMILEVFFAKFLSYFFCGSMTLCGV